MKPRMLIIGARGFVGGNLARAAADDYEVVCADIQPPEAANEIRIDITDGASVDSALAQTRPDQVVLLAALSDIDRCEGAPDLAEALNVRGPSLVAAACAAAGAKLLFTSSAAVFDGTVHGYVEEDMPTAVSVYGRSKARAEMAVLKTLPTAIVLRLALVVGFAGRPGTNAMNDRLRDSFAAGKPVLTPTYEFRNPIDADTLSAFLLELFAIDSPGGILHLGATETISRFDLVTEIAQRLGYSPNLVVPQSEPIPGRAPRGLDHFLRTDKIARLCRTPVPSCSQVIERSLHGTA